jgi:hypothetical protein
MNCKCIDDLYTLYPSHPSIINYDWENLYGEAVRFLANVLTNIMRINLLTSKPANFFQIVLNITLKIMTIRR